MGQPHPTLVMIGTFLFGNPKYIIKPTFVLHSLMHVESCSCISVTAQEPATLQLIGYCCRAVDRCKIAEAISEPHNLRRPS